MINLNFFTKKSDKYLIEINIIMIADDSARGLPSSALEIRTSKEYSLRI